MSQPIHTTSLSHHFTTHPLSYEDLETQLESQAMDMPDLFSSACEKVYKVVVRPDYVSVIVDSEPQYSFVSKIQQLIKELKHTFQKGARVSSYRDRYPSLLSSLISKILDPSAHRNIRKRAQYALILLGKIVPHLAPLHPRIVRFLSLEASTEKLEDFICLDLGTRPKRGPMRKSLETFRDLHFKPLELRLPVLAHTLPKNFVSYPFYRSSSITDRTQKCSHASFWTLHKIIIGSKEDKETLHCYFRELSEIARLEGGLSLRICSETNWLQDIMIFSHSKELLIPRCLAWTKQTCLFMQQITADPLAPHMNAIPGKDLSQTVLQSGLQGAKEAPFCFEGGNILSALDLAGREISLSGTYNILYSVLNGYHFFSTPDKKKLLGKELQRLEGSELFSKDRLLLVQERLAQTGALSGFPQAQDRQFIAKLILAGAQCVLNCMEESLGHPVLVLGDLLDSQPEFHLDLFLLPAPNGIIFIQDHKLSLLALQTISQNYRLMPDEKERVCSYLEFAKEKEKTDGDKLRKIASQLRQTNFTVVPVPGNFYLPMNKPPYAIMPAVCFLNAIVGMGKKGTFCITNGSSHSVDRHLRDIYLHFLQKNGVQNVYFTGRSLLTAGEKGSLHEYGIADKGLEEYGGIHCRTQVVKTRMRDFEIIRKDFSVLQPMDSLLRPIEVSLPLFFQEMVANSHGQTSSDF